MHAVLISGAADPPPGIVALLGSVDFVIAVDGGYDTARALGLAVSRLVGDLDSVSAAGLHHAETAGVPVERHPVEKDATDLYLGIECARTVGADRLTVVSGVGSRVDHLVAELALIASVDLSDVAVEMWIGRARLAMLRGPVSWTAPAISQGELVTLLAVGGKAEGITTGGLRYPLRNETLSPGETRGVSNVAEGTCVDVVVNRGSLLAIRPDAIS